jgi:hypothetical protein
MLPVALVVNVDILGVMMGLNISSLVDVGIILSGWVFVRYHIISVRICVLILDQDAWKEYFDRLRESFDNDCHTLSRAFCYSVDKGLQDAITKAYKNTYESHLFYNSVACDFYIF